MILCHGSSLVVEQPDVLHSRGNVDFGKGFYTTPSLEQAKKWCKKFESSGTAAFLSIYDFDETAFEVCKVLKFETYSEEWLDFVVAHRRGNVNDSYEIVMGGVANDKVFNTIELFFDGLIDKIEAIKRLRYEKPNYQIAFKSQRAIEQFLKLKKSERYDGK